MCDLLLCNFILSTKLVHSQCEKCTTYSLVPSPISGQQITVLTLSFVVYPLWCKVHHVLILQVCNLTFEDLKWASEPDFVAFIHPCGGVLLRTHTIISDRKAVPWYFALLNCINCGVELPVWHKGGLAIIEWCKEVEELVNFSCRHLSLNIEKFSKFKFSTVRKWWEVIFGMVMRWQWRCTGLDVISIKITWCT